MPAASPKSTSSAAGTPPRPALEKDDPSAHWALDLLAFSNVLPAAIAATLTWNSSVLQAAERSFHWAGLAAAGTFIVYGIDRLRDLSRDRLSSPQRTRFIEARLRSYKLTIGAAALVLACLILITPNNAIALLASIGLVGLLHRRLKQIALLKTVYVYFAWTAICVGIPALAAAREPEFALQSTIWLAWILFAAFVANLIASNVRDGDAAFGARWAPRPLAIARLAAYIGIALALLAPGDLVSLVWIPALEALALAFYRPTEHYGLIIVDGALLVGAALSLLHRSIYFPGT